VHQWCEFKSCLGKNKNLTAQKSNSNTVWFNFQKYILYIYTNLTEVMNRYIYQYYRSNEQTVMTDQISDLHGKPRLWHWQCCLAIEFVVGPNYPHYMRVLCVRTGESEYSVLGLVNLVNAFAKSL
jgi:hypothetical protein